ncbi:MAG: PAS domain-containing protein, partial [Alphaproteobacteria bacterium]
WEHGADTVQISASWKRLLGYDRDDIGDQLEDWLNRIHHEDRPRAIRSLQSVIDGKVETHRQIIRMLSKGGKPHAMMQTISAVRGNPGDPPTMVLTQVAAAAAESKLAQTQIKPQRRAPKVA